MHRAEVTSMSWMGRVMVLVSILVLATGASVLAEREPGITSPDPCPAENLVADVTPADATGTTFVGTYAGDTTTDRGMTVFWSVERVYAGEGITDDLFFTTPRCEWANLTPGVRYLFSTAATAFDPSDGAADRPGVTDSLAWEIRAGSEVRLAPFDTYEVDDYGSQELLAITTLEDALSAVAPDAGEGEEPGQLDADFGCAEAPGTIGLDDVRGTTFVGTYLGHERLRSHAPGNLRVVWSVERVYAGGPLPEVLVLRSDACQSVSLPAGQRYLFSSADIVAPGRPGSAAWRLRREGRVRLVPLGNEDLESLPETATRASLDSYEADVRAIRTFEEALEALAPGAGEGELPIRSADRTPG
jgi:hypothetical protein